MNDLFDTARATAPQTNRDRVIELSTRIEQLDRAYHADDEPLVDDATYDAAKRELKALVEADPGMAPFAPALETVGAPPSGDLPEVTHASPMLSLDNAFDLDDMERFASANRRGLGLTDQQPLDLVGELKIDGLSINITFVNGSMTTAATRGDGTTGEDVTANVRTIRGIPHTLPPGAPALVEVRGEIYMPKASLAALNEHSARTGGRILANPRAGAAGSLRAKDPAVTAKRDLAMFAYGIGAWEGTGRPASHIDLLGVLASWGFDESPHATSVHTMEHVAAFNASVAAERAALPYDIDGIVYKQNPMEARRRLGDTRTSPRWAIAWKFDAARAETTVEDITVQVGRTGKLTPVAGLRPVTVGGVVVRRATLHNEDEIERKDVRVGDTVTVERAGDVIPRVVEVKQALRKPDAARFAFPTACPACGSPAIRPDDEVDRRCTGEMACGAQAMTKLEHLAGRTAFDIDGLGKKAIAELHGLGLLTGPADVFRLREHRARIAGLPGWGAKSADKLLKAIEARRTIALERLILALGIRRIGNHASPLLASRYGGYAAWIAAMRSQDQAEWDALAAAGIGPASTTRLREFFAVPTNVEAVEDLARQLTVTDAKPTAPKEGLALSGKTIVFTGTFESMTRDEAKALAVSLGAKTSDSVSRKTSLVVIGADAGGKAAKARELGVEAIDEKAWLEMARPAC